MSKILTGFAQKLRNHFRNHFRDLLAASARRAQTRDIIDSMEWEADYRRALARDSSMKFHSA